MPEKNIKSWSLLHIHPEINVITDDLVCEISQITFFLVLILSLPSVIVFSLSQHELKRKISEARNIL